MAAFKNSSRQTNRQLAEIENSYENVKTRKLCGTQGVIESYLTVFQVKFTVVAQIDQLLI